VHHGAAAEVPIDAASIAPIDPAPINAVPIDGSGGIPMPRGLRSGLHIHGLIYRHCALLVTMLLT
jgi:hypothetical protein